MRACLCVLVHMRRAAVPLRDTSHAVFSGVHAAERPPPLPLPALAPTPLSTHPRTPPPGDTQVNFDDSRFVELVADCRRLHNKLAAKVTAAGVAPPAPDAVAWFEPMPHPMLWNVDGPVVASVGDMLEVGKEVSLP